MVKQKRRAVDNVKKTGKLLEAKDAAERPRYVNFFSLFRYSTMGEKCLFTLGVIFSVILGAIFPLAILIFRVVVNDFMNSHFTTIANSIYQSSIWFAVIGSVALVVAFLQIICVEISSTRQCQRLKNYLLRAIFRQDVAWFDSQSAGQLINLLLEDTVNIQSGIGIKLSEFVQNMSSFITGLVIALCVGWKLALVALSMLPFIMLGFMAFGGLSRRFIREEANAYFQANSVAEEALSSIRTVFAFGGEKREVQRYSSHLDAASRMGTVQATCFGFAAGLIGLSIYCSTALVFWYGVTLIIEESYDAGTVILVFLNVIIGSLFLCGGALPNLRYFYAAKMSGRRVFDVMERVPPIDKQAPGSKPTNFFQQIKFEDVSFSYASRPGTAVLNNVNLTIDRNQMVAFVGSSGSGKSTVVHLLQRFYDPVDGKVTFDGTDLKALDLRWYRDQIGVVSQEPLLFTGTVMENIRLDNQTATDADILAAAKSANAHEFISKLPDGYNTVLQQGVRDLSVGQKQRLAIARALVRKSQLLILDEATSALDSASELAIQQALQTQAASGRTVVVVAHRLSTVQRADRIFVMDKGQLREFGSHEELVSNPTGLYSAMLKTQLRLSRNADSTDDNLVKNGDLPMASDGDLKVNANRDSLMEPALSDSLSSIGMPMHRKQSLSGVVADKTKVSPFSRIMRLSRPETLYLVLGGLAAAITGATQPVFAILYSEIYSVFTLPNDAEAKPGRVSMIAGIMVGLGFTRFLSSILQGYFFGVAGHRLTKRLRSLVFSAMLHQEMAWFDEPANQVSCLISLLASDTSKVNTLSGSSLGRIVESAVLLLLSLVIAFVYNWQLTFIVLLFFPVIVLSSFILIRQMRVDTDQSNETGAIRIALEALSADRTVTSLNLDKYFYNRYVEVTTAEARAYKRRSIAYGLVYALAQSLPICSYAAAFSFGAHLLAKREIQLVEIFKVFAAISFAAQALGRTSNLIPDIKSALKAAHRLLRILDRKSSIPVDEGLRPDWSIGSVPISFSRVSFSYPSRPGLRVLKRFSHTVQPGQKVAFVGQSGCGKTSLFSLLERFYPVGMQNDLCGGTVRLGNTTIASISPVWLRQSIGLVDQEPRLFNISLRDNIAYGDNTRQVSMDEIIAAARLACIHDYISNLPQGYDTVAGREGRSLSGGERQRIAIARALVRQPNLLLLDEATSALDAHTEQMVQEILDAQVEGRTVLSSAHRLSAVRGMDVVVVMGDGANIETGSPDELMLAGGAFHALYHNQSVSQD